MGALVAMLRAVSQAPGLFLVSWSVLSYGLVLSCTSFLPLSFLGCLFEHLPVLQVGASDQKGVVPACLAPGLV